MTEEDDDTLISWDEALKKTPEEGVHVNLDQWLNMWGKLCHGSAGLSDFPVWVQLLPKIYFSVVDQDSELPLFILSISMDFNIPFFQGMASLRRPS